MQLAGCNQKSCLAGRKMRTKHKIVCIKKREHFKINNKSKTPSNKCAWAGIYAGWLEKTKTVHVEREQSEMERIDTQEKRWIQELSKRNHYKREGWYYTSLKKPVSLQGAEVKIFSENISFLYLSHNWTHQNIWFLL